MLITIFFHSVQQYQLFFVYILKLKMNKKQMFQTNEQADQMQQRKTNNDIENAENNNILIRFLDFNQPFDNGGEIFLIATQLIKQYENLGYYENQIFICKLNELDQIFETPNQIMTKDELETKPIFIICNIDFRWVILCITKLHSKVFLLYKDFFYMTMPDSLIKSFEKILSTTSIEIKIQRQEIANNNKQIHSGRMSLSMLQIMIINLAHNSKQRIEFINNFQEPPKNSGISYDPMKELKDYFFSKAKNFYFKNIATDIQCLANDKEFQKAISQFINNIPTDLQQPVQNYSEVLLEEIENFQNGKTANIDHNRIEEFRKKAVGEDVVQNIKNKYPMSNVQQENQSQLEIEAMFPEQMKKFQNIFNILVQIKVDEQLQQKLQDISKALNLDYENLKIFFKESQESFSKKNVKQNNLANNKCQFIEMNEIISNLPPQIKIDQTNQNKSLDQLLNEIKFGQLQESVSQQEQEQIKELETNCNEVQKYIEQWQINDANDIHAWAIKVNKRLANEGINESIAVINRAYQIITGGHSLRFPQILSILTFFQRKDNKGKICQINTGEGKTITVAFLAVILVLQGHQVDVITSNSVLANEGVTQNKSLYSLFQISVDTNNPAEGSEESNQQNKQNSNIKIDIEPKLCYKADVLYSTIAASQFDYLKDSFTDVQIRNGRQFDFLILDEVDNMIIDNAGHIAKISSPFPGMDYLRYIFINIWAELSIAEEKAQSQIYAQQNEFANQMLNSQLTEEQKNLKSEIFIIEQEDQKIALIQQFLKESTNLTNIKVIPSYLQNYCERSLNKWILSAYQAKHLYHKEEQYVVKQYCGERIIQIVDHANTGVLMTNTIWQNGIHQFLQIKEQLQLTPESLTNCFISNHNFIKKYKNPLFGVTGTIGSTSEQELLSTIYNVSYAIIPPYRTKQFKEIDCKVIEDEYFLQIIAEQTTKKLRKGRAVLIICETIKDVNQLFQILKTVPHIQIKIYSDQDSSHVTEEEVRPGEVIIATNIAGRGTNFKAQQALNENGGLHVYVAFLPYNQRVEEQAFGRTSRQGNTGSAQLMIRMSKLIELGINKQEYENLGCELMPRMKFLRDELEQNRLKDIREIKLMELDFNDQIYQEFSSFYHDLAKSAKNKRINEYVLLDIKEQFAFWLDKNEYQGLMLMSMDPKKEFELFKNSIQSSLAGVIRYNPYYSIMEAENLIENDQFKEAEQALFHAFTLVSNPEMLHSAHMKLFEISIEKGKQFMQRAKKAIGNLFFIDTKKDEEYLDKAKTHLDIAVKSIQSEIDIISQICENDAFQNCLTPITSEHTLDKYQEPQYWYNDNDMDVIGQKLLKEIDHNININLHFKNRLTEDQIDFFCNEINLLSNVPIYICYNMGGKLRQKGGLHWIAICIVQIESQIHILYKDSKGDFNNNSKIVQTMFRKHYKNMVFITNDNKDQDDNSSCGPLTIKNLCIMCEQINNSGLKHLVDNFMSIKFGNQRDVQKLRNQFGVILHTQKNKNPKNKHQNVLLKHLKSRQKGLYVILTHASNIRQQICDNTSKSFLIGTRKDTCFSKIESGQNENEILNDQINDIAQTAFTDFAAIGANIEYALKESHDVPPEIIKTAQCQIGAGIAAYGICIFFPPALFIAGPIAGTLINEGICDIATELINYGNSEFNKQAFTKAKVYSYACSLLSFGISALLSCPKVLACAAKYCKKISTYLRGCKYFKTICGFLADQFDKIEQIFLNLEALAKYKALSQTEKYEYLNLLKEQKNLTELNKLGEFVNEIHSLQHAYNKSNLTKLSEMAYNNTKNTLWNVGGLMANKTAKLAGETILQKYKPLIEKQVEKVLQQTLNMEKLKSTNQDIFQIMTDSKSTNLLQDLAIILKNQFFGMLQNQNTWSILKFASLGFQTSKSFIEIYNYSENLCKKINEKLISGNNNSNVDNIIRNLTKQISQEIFDLIISNSIVTLKNGYEVAKQSYQNYKEDLEYRKHIAYIEKGEQGLGQEIIIAFSELKQRKVIVTFKDPNQNDQQVIIGEQMQGTPVYLDYYPPDGNNMIGHYVPAGKDKDFSAFNTKINEQKNQCLIEALASESQNDASELKKELVQQIKTNPSKYINLNVHGNKYWEEVNMSGGEIQKKTKNLNQNIKQFDPRFQTDEFGTFKMSKEGCFLCSLVNILQTEEATLVNDVGGYKKNDKLNEKQMMLLALSEGCIDKNDNLDSKKFLAFFGYEGGHIKRTDFYQIKTLLQNYHIIGHTGNHFANIIDVNPDGTFTVVDTGSNYIQTYHFKNFRIVGMTKKKN